MNTAPKVLVVDDDPDARQIAETLLRNAGFEVLTAADGKSGLELIHSQRPRVVVLDLMMPGTHGFSVCQAVRNDPALNDVHIIVVSSKAYATDIKKAKELGATDYLIKPFDVNELLAKVRTLAGTADNPLCVKFWGTRGSIPTPGPATARYGGNTSCVEVRSGETILMLDAGSGAREMGLALAREFSGRPLDLHVFISHTHWDHIQGFPFFVPAYGPRNRITLYSLHGTDKSLQKVFTGQMDAAYFPVELSEMQAELRFIELEGPVTVGEIQITHTFLNHPGLAIAFRLEARRKSIVYMTDHEHHCRLQGDNEHNRRLERAVVEFARHADLYIREAQYTEEEYPSKRGWGHSTWVDALEAAHEAGVKRLALYHHDPMHDDDALDRMLAACQARMKERGMHFSCLAAADHLELTF
ncbi:MAG: response regulator [Candidatus Acidiferrales bacterium]